MPPGPAPIRSWSRRSRRGCAIACARPRAARRLILVDRRTDTIRAGALVVQLGGRPACATCSTPCWRSGRAFDKPALARAIGSVEYRSVHDGALWVTVKRLRALLAPAGLRITGDDDGVRLRPEPDCELEVI
jgi:hypothetical protein